MKKTLAILWLAALGAAPAMAAMTMTPLQIGIAGERAQLFRPETQVMGLRLNLAFSENQDVMGLDVGLLSRSDRMSAIQLNLANWVEEEFVGVGAGLFNTMGSMAGLQVGIFNAVEQDMAGFQVGVFNMADNATGLQIGLINRTVSLRGIQIGLVNIIEEGPLTFFPIINAAF